LIHEEQFSAFGKFADAAKSFSTEWAVSGRSLHLQIRRGSDSELTFTLLRNRGFDLKFELLPAASSPTPAYWPRTCDNQ